MYQLTLFVVLVFGPPVPGPGDQAPAVAALVKALGADDFDARVAAQDALEKIAKVAARPLVAAAAGKDPEVAYRASAILRKHFDAVDFGGSGRGAPRLADAAGRREWVTVMGENGTWAVYWLPPEGFARRLAERYGRRVLAARGETAGVVGSNESDDPLCDPVQRAATLALFRELQLAGATPRTLKVLAALLEWHQVEDQ